MFFSFSNRRLTALGSVQPTDLRPQDWWHARRGLRLPTHPGAAFVRRDLEQVASISAFYRKLGGMELAVTEEIVRRTAVRAGN